VRDCFGCFGLRHAQYCIFNKQYTKEEYEVLVPRIIEHMKQTGEWGEFFPIEISFYGYNESLAQQFFPLTKEDAIAKGYPWYEQKQEKENYLGPDRVVPDNSEPLPDDITDTIFTCSVTGQPYRFTKQEIEFYAQLGLPLPTKCPQQRHKERFERRNPRKLWDRECGKCAKAVKSTFSSQKPEIIYCEDCYLSQIY
jgi:hypothetical protein